MTAPTPDEAAAREKFRWAWEVERDALRAELADADSAWQEARAREAAVRPVLDAARAYAERWGRWSTNNPMTDQEHFDLGHAIFLAVDAYDFPKGGVKAEVEAVAADKRDAIEQLFGRDAPAEAPDEPGPPRPKIVTICGSMRFFDQMLQVAAEETVKGHIVVAPFSIVAPEDQGSEVKARLDELHRRKIDMADEVIIVTNQDGYIGTSTRAEMVYAAQRGMTWDVREFHVEAPGVGQPAGDTTQPVEPELGYDELRDRPCPGHLRFRWGMGDAPCDTCGGRCGVAVAKWERVEPVRALAEAGAPAQPDDVRTLLAGYLRVIGAGPTMPNEDPYLLTADAILMLLGSDGLTVTRAALAGAADTDRESTP